MRRSYLTPTRLLVLGFTFLLVSFLVAPFWSQTGLPFSADGALHLHRGSAVTRSLAHGLFRPVWFAAVYEGLGSPVFHYAAPVFYVLLAPLHWVGLPLDTATKLIISVYYLISGLAAFAWLRRLAGPAAGMAGAAIYLSQPAFYREFYFQGNFPQWLALLWLPVILWALTRLYEQDAWQNWLLATASLAVLALTHNITAMLGGGLVVSYTLILLWWRRDWRGWRRCLLAGLLAIGLSAVFWLPALADSGLVRLGNLREGFFRYDQYFLNLSDLLTGTPLLDARAGNPPQLKMLGWAAVATLIFAAVVLIWGLISRKPERGVRKLIAAGLLLTLSVSLLMTRFSAPIWEIIFPLQWLQYPTRLLGLAAVGIALAVGAAVATLKGRWQNLALAGVLVAVALSSAVFLFPRQPFQRIESLSVTNTQAFERETGIWGTSSGNEYLPRWANVDFATDVAAIDRLKAASTTALAWLNANRAELRAADDGMIPAGGLSLPLHYHPAWRAAIGDQSLQTQPDASGLMTISVPQPVQSISLSWQPTTAQRAGDLLSLLAAGALAAVMLWSYRHASADAHPKTADNATSVFLPAIAVLIALIIIWKILALADVHPFRQDSPPDDIIGMQHHSDVQLGGAGQPEVLLKGWDLLSGIEAFPGEQVRLRLYWQVPETLSDDLAGFVHLYTTATKQTWAIGRFANPARVPPRRWLPYYYYVEDIVIDLPPDLPPLQYALTAGMTTADGRRLANPGQPDGMASLGEIDVQPLPIQRAHNLQPDVRAEANFDGDLRLHGYDLLPDPGGPILRLYWETLIPVSQDLVAFVHLLDPQGQVIRQFDAPPFEGLLGTSQWQPGTILVDSRKLTFPDTLSSGEHTLLMGLYDSQTGRRSVIEPASGYVDHFMENALRITFVAP